MSIIKKKVLHLIQLFVSYLEQKICIRLYYAFNNPELKETAYSISYIYASKYLKEIPITENPDEDNTISYMKKYEENIANETSGLYLFLIDQSYSMGGKPIELVKQTLL